VRIPFQIMGRSYHTVEDLPAELDLPDGSTVGDALAAVTALLPANQQLPGSCLVVLSGRHLGTVARHEDSAVRQQDELLLVAPVAGG